MIASALLCLALLFSGQEQANPRGGGAAASTEESYRISGTVVDAVTGQSLSGVQVSITGRNVPDGDQTTVTLEDGRFAFEGVAAGKYALSARRRGYLQQSYKQHQQFSTAIVTGPGLQTENLRFELRPGGSISGQVSDEAGEPVRNAQVTLFRRDVLFGRRSTYQENQEQTNDLGQYRFGHLEPGTYFVAVSATPWYAQRGQYRFVSHSGEAQQQVVRMSEPQLDVVYATTFFPNAHDVAGAAPITVHSGDVEVADVRLQAAPGARLIVRTPVSGENTNVWAQPWQALPGGGRTNLQAASQQIAPGVLELSGLPAGEVELEVTVNKDGESSVRRQTVRVGDNTEVNVADASAPATVSGVATLEDGTPPGSGVFFQLRSTPDRGRVYQMRTDEKGGFELKDQQVMPGTYELWVGRQTPPAMVVKSMTATNAKVLTARSLEIGSGLEVKLNVVLSAGEGEVTGFALKDGKGVDGVMVVLAPEIAEHNIVLFRRDQSDSDGSFTLPGVHAGKYTVLAVENGWDLEWSTPEVLKKYLPGGEHVEVMPNAKVQVKVKVQ